MKNFNLPKVLKEKLQEKGMQQLELAQKLGYKQQTISQYVHGINKPDLITALKIADILDISLDELVTGEKYENKTTRENLKLSEKAIENLKMLSKIDFAEELLSDDNFVNLYDGVVRSFEINITGTRNHPTYINSHGEKMSLTEFFDNVENLAALQFYNYFKYFFTQVNFIRNNKEMPKNVKNALERAEQIASYFTKIDISE